LLLDIRAVHYDRFNCFEDLCISVASWLNYSYQLAFCNSWSFEYNAAGMNTPGLIGDLISPGNMELYSVTENVLGLKCCWNGRENIEDMYSLVSKNIENNLPVIINIQPFYYPWHKLYKNVPGGSPHYCLAVGIEADKSILCIDSVYHRGEILKLDFDDFSRGCNHCISFEQNPSFEGIDFESLLKSSIKKVTATNFFDSIRVFSNEFRDTFNYDLEFKRIDSGIWEVFFYKNIKQIAGGRELYIKFLNFISGDEKLKWLSEYTGQLQAALTKWSFIAGFLWKCHYTGFDRKYNDKLAKIIMEAADIEEAFAGSMSRKLIC
jgi:hypothetical protein